MSSRSAQTFASVAIAMAILLTSGCDGTVGQRLILGAGEGRVVIVEATVSSPLDVIAVYVQLRPPAKRIFTVDLTDGSVTTIQPATDYSSPLSFGVSDGRRIIGRELLTNSIVVQDAVAGDVKRFMEGSAGYHISATDADMGLALLRVSDSPESTSAILLDTQSGQQRVLDLGLVNYFPVLSGDYVVTFGTLRPATFVFASLNWRTGGRRILATSESVRKSAVIGSEVFWVAEASAGQGNVALIARAASITCPQDLFLQSPRDC